jgi:uncharacterized membrane protein YbhN (UPF0104 family)
MHKGPLYFIVKTAKKSIGFLLFVVCSLGIYYKVLHDIAWNQFWISIHEQLVAISSFQWIVLLILFALNFFIEAYKWKLVMYKINPLPLHKAITSLFIGQAFAFFTPNRVGEYAGRTLMLDSGNKVLGMAQMAWTSYAQLLVTILIGTVALFINSYFYSLLYAPIMLTIKLVAPVIAIIALTVFFYERKWTGWLSFLNKIQVKPLIKLNLLGLSLIRYGIFLLQYIWVAQMLNLNIEADTLVLSIAILFLCLSILPTISFTELPVRGQLLLWLLAPFSHDKMMIVSLSTFIWSVNLLIPAILGALLLLKYRLNE